MELLSQGPKYGKSQYLAYLKHIGMLNIDDANQYSHLEGGELRDSPLDSSQLQYLRDLQKMHLARIPFENLSLHYSSHKTIDLDPTALFEKIVEYRRGGYCMEQNCFFGCMLEFRGYYKVCSVGARVHEGKGVYTGWSHMVNLVTLADGQRYLVDVGFGNNGPTQPLLLLDGHEEESISPSSMRLVRANITTTTNPSERLWIYQHRSNATSDWEAIYCFTEMEFFPRDYEMMNFWTSQSRKSFFTHRIMCVKLIMDEKTSALVGTLILNGGEVKQVIGGKTEQVRNCRTEAERIEALEDLFGIRLTKHDRQGIAGTGTALPEAEPQP